ncbi:hypothetical protein [Hymenobacter daecheongensis]|nr:hypothetical protein [Hymenobacter daecheongensis]
MKSSFKKTSKRNDPRQAEREARKRARPVFEPGKARLAFVTEAGHEVWELLPQPQIPGYTYAF